MAYLDDHPNRRKPQQRKPRRARLSGVIVVHTAENTPDMVAFDGGAEAVARYISTRDTYGSYHVLADSDSIIQVVDFDAEAFHDGTGSNPHSIGISGATRADVWPWAPKAWRDGCIDNMARGAAAAARHIRARTGIVVPPTRITRRESEDRHPGFIAHGTRDPGRRTDPGPAFPWSQFFDRYRLHAADVLGGRPTTPTPPPSEELTVAQIDDLMKRLDTLERASNRNYTAVLNAGAVLLELREELIAPVGADGSTRADRLAKVPDAVKRLEAAVAELHKASEG